jgi:hypothetical protein
VLARFSAFWPVSDHLVGFLHMLQRPPLMA